MGAVLFHVGEQADR